MKDLNLKLSWLETDIETGEVEERILYINGIFELFQWLSQSLQKGISEYKISEIEEHSDRYEEGYADGQADAQLVLDGLKAKFNDIYYQLDDMLDLADQMHDLAEEMQSDACDGEEKCEL